MAEKYVYLFGTETTDGDASMRNLLGGKGANLAEMAGLGLPVPAGFTITTEVCTYFYEHDNRYPPELEAQVDASIKELEKTMGGEFGNPANPLLVSVRSGARVSMPGMMDTVLNLGLNDEIVEGLIKISGNERFCYDVYRRFVQMYGDVVMECREEGKEIDPFEQLLEAKKELRGVELDNELSAADMKDLAHEFKAEIKKRLGQDFPVSVLINGAEYGVDKGITLEESQEFARIIAEAGVDAIHVRAHGYGEYLAQLQPEEVFYPEPPKPLAEPLDGSHHGAGATVPLAAAGPRSVHSR